MDSHSIRTTLIIALLTYGIAAFGQGGCPDQRIYVFGRLNCKACGMYPDISVRLIDENKVAVGNDLFVENIQNPFKFEGCVKSIDDVQISVEIHDPLGFIMDPKVSKEIEKGISKEIRIFRVQDHYIKTIDKAHELFKSDNYDAVKNEINEFYSLGLKLTASQDYRMIKLLGESYEKIGDIGSAIDVIEGFLSQEPTLRNGQRFEILSQLGKTYALEANFLGQKEVLEDISKTVDLTTIRADRRVSYFKERLNSLLNLGEYLGYRNPSIDLANDIVDGVSVVSLNDWTSFFNEWTNLQKVSLPSYDKERPELVSQLEFALNKIND